jgi:hypothetical protein
MADRRACCLGTLLHYHGGLARQHERIISTAEAMVWSWELAAAAVGIGCEGDKQQQLEAYPAAKAMACCELHAGEDSWRYQWWSGEEAGSLATIATHGT